MAIAFGLLGTLQQYCTDLYSQTLLSPFRKESFSTQRNNQYAFLSPRRDAEGREGNSIIVIARCRHCEVRSNLKAVINYGDSLWSAWYLATILR
jgi:hypothetical protein